MKLKEIVKRYDIDGIQFVEWLKQSEYIYTSSVLGAVDVDDSQSIESIVDSFRQHEEDREHAIQQELDDRERTDQQERQEQEFADQRKQTALKEMIITSGFGFEGFSITKYSGYISGDHAVQIDRGTQGFFGGGVTDVGQALMKSLSEIRQKALTELKEAAYELGCNAVIGVDFDYLTLDPETAGNGGGTLYLPYVFGVTANGNAVIIEEINRAVSA